MLENQIEVACQFGFRHIGTTMGPVRAIGQEPCGEYVVQTPQSSERRARVKTDLGSPAKVEEALDRAVFNANEMRDYHMLGDLTEARAKRAAHIHEAFDQMANELIGMIEAHEGWDNWLARVK